MWKMIRRRLRRARLSLPTPLAVFTLLAGVAVTSMLYAGVRDVEHERARADFVQAAESRFAAVERSFRNATDAVHSLNQLFAAVGNVSRAEFDAYATPLAALHPEVQALVFHRFVGGDERAAFEASRAADFPGFQITERGPGGIVRAGERGRYLVDDYIVPLAGNEVTLGFDAWSNPPQRVLAEYAIDTGLAAASEVLPLLQRNGAAGVVIVMPVYRQGMPLTNVAERRRAVLGDTEVVINLAGLVRRNLADAGLLDRPGTMLTLASTAAGGKPVAYRYGTPAAAMAQGLWGRWLRGPGFSNVRTVEVAGRPWRITVAAREGALPVHLGSVGMLALGLVLSTVMAFYVQARVRRTRRIEHLVEERTGALKRASDALRLYQRAIESSENAILLVSARLPGWPIEYANPACQRLLGRSAPDLIGQLISTLASVEPDQASIHELSAAMRARRAAHALVRHHDAHGGEVYSEVYVAPVIDPAGDTEHFVMSLYDVTTTKRYEAELEHRARHDALTGLANRVLLADRIELAIGFAAANGEPVWVAALDLDQFRLFNDTLGHQAGDQLLQLVAPRLAGALQRTDTVARTGGDEFVLVMPGYRDERQAAAALRRVLDAVAQPLVLHGQTLFVTCSAGVAVYPGDGQDPATLVKHAELAMYRAKDAGRNAVEFFRPAMTARARERLDLENALRHALARGEFELHYQPQVALASGRVVGVEALIRWRHPRFGTVLPDRFIALAEETGLIVPIGSWVLRTACRQNRAWQNAGYGPLRIAVNLSARQFAEPGLSDAIGATLIDAGMRPECLEIEVTESLMMADVDAAERTMHELKQMGVGLSIDDFGTGYSSLSYLKRFPVDVLKIDRSFVHDLAAGADDAAMVDAIISLARGLHMRVIAEGVETRAQLDYLRSHGCDEVQGHLYSRALPVAEVEPILRRGRCLEAA
jgi:diguanylate cyclase (GGDEF)-like protein/PAS domain S-box-containing protein